MSEVYCCSESTYSHALTYGKSYVIRANDPEKWQVRVKGDHGRLGWFHYGSFTTKPVPTLAKWVFDDEPNKDDGPIEVSLELSDGRRKWCNIVTPGILQRLLEREAFIGGFGYITVKEITEPVVDRAITELVANGALLNKRYFWDIGEEPSSELCDLQPTDT